VKSKVSMKLINRRKSLAGFTLMEVLIALFIFTILSFLLATALRTVINAQAGTENKAQRLRDLQMALLVMSRDIEQAINRPITNSVGQEEAAFVGTQNGFALTHAGFANPFGLAVHSNLQRTGYYWKENHLSRLTWLVLDQAPETKAHERILLMNIMNAHFQYMDEGGRFRDAWPIEEDTAQVLPRAVKIYLSIGEWGEMTQLYLIPVHINKKENPKDEVKEKGQHEDEGEGEE
jgi:general secretion pathway protein J